MHRWWRNPWIILCNIPTCCFGPSSKMSHHVSKMLQTCTYKLLLINVIRNRLTVTVAERVISAMVTGNLDFCNSLFNGITANEISHIKKLQNTATRLILEIDRRSRATVMLNDLHWLSIKKRVMCKILLLVCIMTG